MMHRQQKKLLIQLAAASITLLAAVPLLREARRHPDVQDTPADAPQVELDPSVEIDSLLSAVEESPFDRTGAEDDPDAGSAPAAEEQDGTPPQMPWDQVRSMAIGLSEFGRVEADTIRRRFLGWKVGSSYVDVPPMQLINPDNKEMTEYDQRDFDDLVALHNAELQVMYEATVELAKDAYKDYYNGERFLRLNAGVELPPAPPTKGSEFYTDAHMTNYFGWNLQFAFRSADYPVLNDHFVQVKEMHADRMNAARAFISSL